MAFGYFSGDMTPEQIAQRREIIKQIIGDTGSAQNWGEGLGDMLAGFAAGVAGNNLAKVEAANNAKGAEMFNNLGLFGSSAPSGAGMSDVPSSPSRAAGSPADALKTRIMGGASEKALGMIKKFEGFRKNPYWDVNALRAGYGSDTVTLPDGTVRRVGKGTSVSVADADRDLQRRINSEFMPIASKAVGADKFASLPPDAQAALTSISYNYGRLPSSVAKAVATPGIADDVSAIQALKSHNNGVNAARRLQEASLYQAAFSGNPVISPASSPPEPQIPLSGGSRPLAAAMTPAQFPAAGGPSVGQQMPIGQPRRMFGNSDGFDALTRGMTPEQIAMLTGGRVAQPNPQQPSPQPQQMVQSGQFTPDAIGLPTASARQKPTSPDTLGFPVAQPPTAVPQAALPTVQSDQGRIQRMAAFLASPYGTPEQKAIVNMALKQEMERADRAAQMEIVRADPARQLDMQFKQVQMDKMRAEIAKANSPDARARLGLSPQYGVDANGNPVLLQIGEDGNAVQTKMPNGVTLSKEPIKLDAGTHFVLLDPITRQPVGQIPKNLAGAEAQKTIGENAGKQVAAAPADLQAGQNALDLIDQIESSPYIDRGTGFSSLMNGVPGTGGMDFQNLVDQAKSGAFLSAIQQMRGMGSLSNAEGEAATKSITRLRTSTSKEAFIAALRDYKNIVNQGMARARAKMAAPGGEILRQYAPQAAPQAAPQQSGGGWTIEEVP